MASAATLFSGVRSPRCCPSAVSDRASSRFSTRPRYWLGISIASAAAPAAITLNSVPVTALALSSRTSFAAASMTPVATPTCGNTWPVTINALSTTLPRTAPELSTSLVTPGIICAIRIRALSARSIFGTFSTLSPSMDSGRR